MRQIATAQHLADLVCKGMPKLIFSMDFMGGNVDLTSEDTELRSVFWQFESIQPESSGSLHLISQSYTPELDAALSFLHIKLCVCERNIVHI